MNSIIYLKTALSVFLALAVLGVEFFRKQSLLQNHHLFFFLLRLVPFIVIYVVLDYGIQSDVNAFYEQASAALQGKLVYKEFSSFHSPAFPYLIALPLLIFHSGKSIILLFILLEYVTVCLLKFIISDNKRFNRLASLYWIMPSSLIFTVLGGQEDFLLFTFYALFLISLIRKWNPIVSGFVFFCGLFFTKIIYVLPLGGILLLFFSNKKLVFSFVFFTALFYGATYLVVGKSILLPYSEAASFSPPNIWYLLNPVAKFEMSSISKITLGSLLAVIFIGILLQARLKKIDKPTAAVSIYVVCFALFYVLSPKSMGNYLGAFLLPLTFLAFPIKQLQLPILALSVLSAVHPSLWWRSGLPLHNSFNPLFSSVVFLIEYTMVIAIIGLCLFLAYSIVKRKLPSLLPPMTMPPTTAAGDL